MSVFYVAGVFLFNAETYVRLDQYYAHSGRYLLPVLVPAAAAALTAARWIWRAAPGWSQGGLATVALVLVVAFGLTHSSVVSFLSYVDGPAWFSETARPFAVPVLELLGRHGPG